MVFDLGEFMAAGAPVPAAEDLSWRLDPEVSMSDWKIVVQDTTAERAATTYHVHRAILGVAPRRSDYFAKAFLASGFAEGTTHSTELELEPSACDAFPIFLDFMYSGELEATTTLATALRHCAKYFVVSELYESINAFIQGDLNVTTAPTYFDEGETYADEKLQAAALSLCVDNFATIDVGNLERLPPPLFARIVSMLVHPADGGVRLSAHVASYCRAHPNAVDAKMLRALTPADKMVFIDPSEAIFLLELSLKLALPGADGGTGVYSPSSVTAEVAAADGDDTLRARCTRACTDTWESTLAGVACAAPETKAAVSPSTAPGAEAASSEGPSSKRRRTEETAASLTTPYDRLPSDVKIELLEAALKKARTDIIGSKFEAALTARNERRVARCYFCGEAGGFCE